MGQDLVSLVIVNWNGLDYLPECLASARGQRYRPLEVVVVDNGSTDGSREWLRGSGATVVELDRNTGFAAGINAGIARTRGPFVALLNNDAVAAEDWVEHLVEAMREPDVGMVASKIAFYDRRDVIDKTGHLLYPDGLNRGRGAGEIDRGQFEVEDEVLFPDGCAALYRRAMLDEIGLFDEQFFAYGDDAELGLRARWRGWRCRYAPRARVYHRHSSSLGKYSPRKAFLVERNRIWVAAKVLPWPVIALSPLLTLWRYAWHVRSLAGARGLAGGVAREHSAWSLFVALVRAYASAVAGLPSILAKRRAIFRTRTLKRREFYALLRRFRMSAREVALRD